MLFYTYSYTKDGVAWDRVNSPLKFWIKSTKVNLMSLSGIYIISIKVVQCKDFKYDTFDLWPLRSFDWSEGDNNVLIMMYRAI